VRVKRFIVGAATVLVAVLGPSSAAHADNTPPEITSLECESASNTITCTVQFVGGPSTIEWFGGPKAARDLNKGRRTFRCGPRLFGLNYKVEVRVTTPGVGFDTEVKRLPCNGQASPRTSAIFCEPTPTVGLPNGTYFVCDVVWGGDGSAATAQWVNPQAKRRPAVTVNSDEGWTTATFDCNNPGGPDLTFGSYVSITDAAGTMTTPATIPCGW
jgi:hypothetical protein